MKKEKTIPGIIKLLDDHIKECKETIYKSKKIYTSEVKAHHEGRQSAFEQLKYELDQYCSLKKKDK